MIVPCCTTTPKAGRDRWASLTFLPAPEVRDFFENEAWVGGFDRLEAFLVRER